MASSDPPDSFQVLLREADEIRALKESNRAAINTLFGVVLPVTMTVFVASYNRDLQLLDRAGIGGAFIALISLSTIWSQFLWAEYFSLLEFYYTQILPRIYAAGGVEGKLNYLQWTLPRRSVEWIPIALFNFGYLAAMLVVFFLTIWPLHNRLAYWVLLFPLGAVCSLSSVTLQLARLRRKVKQSNLRVGV